MDIAQLLKESWEKFIAEIVLLILFVLVGGLLCFTIILIPVVMTGMTRAFIGYVRDGRKPEYSDLWSHWDTFIQILLQFIVMGILLSIGFALFIIPGIFLMTIWMYAMFYLVDRNMGFWESMEASRNVVMESGIGMSFVLILIVSLINSVGGLVAVGVLFTAPFTMVVLALAYIENSGSIATTQI